MSQALQRLNNEIFIIEGYVYSYDSPEYEFVKSMKFDGYGEKDELSCFLFNMKVKDPIYDKKDELYPLVRYVGKTIKENGFKSNFVGVLYDSTDKKLISLPKYTYRLLKLESKEKQQVSEKYWEDLKFLMERYSEQLESRDPLFCACNDAEHSEWGFAKRFLEWYDENGQYTQRRKEESKKKGRTSWSKTVNRIVPDYIQDNIIYPKTIKEIYTNSYDDITDLQMSILNYLYNEKGYYEKNSFISDNPAFTHFEVGDTCIDIKELIEDEELCVQWIDKITFMKQMNFRDDYDALFDLLIKFLKQDFTSSNGDGLYGIFKFDNLFEVVLSDFFGNQLEIQKYNKYISVQLNSSLMTNKIIPDVNNAYYDCVEYEFVQGKENTYEIKKYDRKTNEHILIPDIVFEFQKDSINYVFIIDAKYYDYHFVEQDDV